MLGLLTQEQVPLQVRQAAAVFFKNVVRRHWEPEDEHELTIPDEIKTQVKDNLLQLFLAVAELLQSQLSEAMALIASHDFPAKWQTLLPGLLPQLETATTGKDYKRVMGLLQILHSICKRYRHEFKSDELFSEIKYVLETLQAPLLAIFKQAGHAPLQPPRTPLQPRRPHWSPPRPLAAASAPLAAPQTPSKPPSSLLHPSRDLGRVWL